jgi:hypothetical protein
MRKATLCILLLIGVIYSSFSQDSSELRRTPYKLSIMVDRQSTYEQNIPATPYIFPDKTIQIYPGETIYVEVLQNNGIINSFKAVKEIKDATHTLTITLKQNSENGVHQNMMLTIHNPFSEKLIYKATMSTLTNKNWVTTDVYPVEPGLSGIEIWPDIILSLGLRHWEFKK